MDGREVMKGRILIVSTALLWGLAGVCVKMISWNSMSLVAVRSFLSAALLLAYKRSFKIRFTKKNIWGAVMMSATGMLYVESIKLTTAGTAIVLQYIAPILVFLFAVLFRHRKVRLYEILITFAVFGGIVLSFADTLDAAHVVGNILGLASGFTFAGQIIIMNDKEADSMDSLIISCLISFVIAFPFMFFDTSLVFNAQNIIWVLILGIFQYGMSNLLFGIGIQKIESVEASLFLTIEPIFNPIPVAIIYGEKMGPLAVIGFALVIVFVTMYAVIPELIKRKNKKQGT